MNLRKIIAVLSAVLMLCAIIPMSAVSVSAANLLSNGTFDSNTNGWGKTGSTVMVAEDGALKATHADDWAYVYTWLNVEAGSDYTLSFRAKASAGGFKVNFNNSSWGSAGIASQTPSITTEWKEYELDFNTGSYGGQLLVFFNSTLPGSYAQTIWLDDVVIAPKAATLFEGDNLFVNGDFEAGNTNGWNKHQQTTVTAGAAKDGSYGAYLNGNSASWGGVLDQTVNVIPGKQYVFSFDSKAVVQGLNWSLTGVQSGTKYAGSYAKHTEWDHFELKFRPEGDTQLKLNFNCGGGSGTDEMYVDNVSLLKVREMSNDGYLKNGTFDMGNYDNWTSLWGSTALEIVEGGHDSDYALKGTASGAWNITYQEIAVEANTDYIISAWAKDSTNAALWIKGAGGNGDMGSATFSSSDWAKATVEVNSGSNTSLWVGLMGLEAGATYIVDDILVLKKIPASDDGYIYNGNFESGKKESFNFDQQTAISMDAAKDGNFGAELKGNGGWGGMLGYTFAVEAGATYELSFEAKALSNGANVTVLADTWQGAKLKTGWIGGNEWKTYTLEFVATTNQCYLNINGAGNGTAEHIYLDNLGVVKTKDAHVCNVVEQERVDATCGADGYIKYACDCGLGEYTEPIPATGEHTYDDAFDTDCNVCGAVRAVVAPANKVGFSASEDVHGLAVKFIVPVQNMGIDVTTAIYDNATLNGYKLISMGAIATNGVSSVDIPVVYLCNDDVSENVQFAIRVKNIPEDKGDVSITFTPYVVVEIDGEQTTIFGEAVSSTYNAQF